MPSYSALTPASRITFVGNVLGADAEGAVSRTVDIATVAKTCDFDWLFIDMEHSSLDVDLPSQLAMASLGAGITPIVRIPGHEHYHASLETPKAIANADAIAQVEGVDVLLIGTNDLCAEMGMPGQFADAKVESAYQTVIEACRKHGKFPGMGGVYDPKLMDKYIGIGMRFILSGSDLSFIMAGARERSNMLRSVKR